MSTIQASPQGVELDKLLLMSRGYRTMGHLRLVNLLPTSSILPANLKLKSETR
jgi:hypothetical protein